MRQRYAVVVLVAAMVVTMLGGLAGRPAVAAEPGVTGYMPTAAHTYHAPT